MNAALRRRQPVRGMKDYWPDELRQRMAIESIMEKVVKLCGFRPIETPIVEFTDVFTNTLGTDSDVVNKEMYTFPSRSGESLSLRPENTASIARAAMQGNRLYTESKPLKLYYSGPMFRYERPQKGRYRQFNQFGVEILGTNHPSMDAEAISSAYLCLKELGLTEAVELRINSLGDSISRERYESCLREFLSTRKEELSEDSQKRYADGKVLRIVDSKSEADQRVLRDAPSLGEFLSDASKQSFEYIHKLVESSLDIPIRIDSQLVRGLDYYSETVFEFTELESAKRNLLGKANTVLAGGRYELSTGGSEQTNSLGGIGWAAGTDRLRLLCDKDMSPARSPVILVAGVKHRQTEDSELKKLGNAVFSVTHKLRQSVLSSDYSRLEEAEVLCSDSSDVVQKQLKMANRLNVHLLILLGTDELQNNTASIKNMITGEQREVESGLLPTTVLNMASSLMKD